MTALVLIVAATFALSAALTRYLCSSRTIVNILDEPNGRSLHRTATPRTGGLAILLSVFAASAVSLLALRAGWLHGLAARGAADLLTTEFRAVGISTLFLAAVSLWDDLRDLSPLVRFLAQTVAAAALVLGANFTIATFWVPGYGPIVLDWAAYPITLLFAVWMTNLYNFMDGLDGLSGGMTLIGFGFMGYLAFLHGGAGIGFVSILVAAGAAGFLLFNYPPARIFMGDVGSVPIGLLVASLAIKANRDQTMGLWVPLILFSPFIADATVVLVRRLLRGERIWEAHRSHYYQRLVLAGWSHTKTLWVEYVAMAACAGLAVYYKQGVEVGRPIVIAAVAAAYAGVGAFVTAVERRAASARPRLRMVK
jgi:UDP-N-acetylmuramyl pentapeptide phosphotransferase/UDP-N-acetylglucosamine-1-phosphate transferase